MTHEVGREYADWQWWLLRRKVRAVVAQELVKEAVKTRRSIYSKGPEKCRIDDRSVGRETGTTSARVDEGTKRLSAARHSGTQNAKCYW